MKVLLRELQEEKFNIKEWPADMKTEEVTALAIAIDQTSQELHECLAVVDAKSLYDYLAKETIGGQEVQIIREELKQLNGASVG